MKRNDLIYIWLIIGTLFLFIYYLARKDFERKDRIEEQCVLGSIGTIYSPIMKKEFVICDGPEKPILKEISK